MILELLSALFISSAAAQNVTCSTRPPGDNSNACASTAFVQATVGGGCTALGAFPVGTGGSTQCSTTAGAVGNIVGDVFINESTGSPSTPSQAPFQLRITALDANHAQIVLQSFGSDGALSAFAADGTANAPTATAINRTLLNLNAKGWDGAAWGNAGAGNVSVSFYAAEAQAVGAHGAYMAFETTPIGSTTRSQRVFVTASGGLAVGLSTNTTAGVVNALTGFQINSAAASGQVLRGNGTNFVSASLGFGDLAPGGTAPIFTLGGTVTGGGFSISGLSNVISDVFSLVGTGGAGFMGMAGQSSNPAGAPGVGNLRFFADSTGKLSWQRSDGFSRSFDSTLTGNRIYTLPDASVTLAGLSLTQSWTADQTYTSARNIFSGAITLSGATTGVVDISNTITNSAVVVAGVNIAPTLNGASSFPVGLRVAPTFTPSASIATAQAFRTFGIVSPAVGVTITEVDAWYAVMVYSNVAGAVTTGKTVVVDAPTVSGALHPTTHYGLHILNQGMASTTTSHAMVIDAQSGSTTNNALTVAGGNITFTLTTDATHTTRTVCQDTTSSILFFGSGAASICLGTSGAQFKTSFAPMNVGLNELTQIPFHNYRYRPGYGDDGERTQYGPTAQEVEQVLPGLVRHNAQGEAINYDWGALMFIGLRATQQLEARVRALEAK